MRSRLIKLAILYLVACLAFLAINGVVRHRDYERNQRRIQTTDELLDTPVRCQDDSTLVEAMNAVRSDTGLPIIVKWDSLAKVGIRRNTPIAIACHDDPLAVVLRVLLWSAAGHSPSHVQARWYQSDAGFYVDDQGRVVVCALCDVQRSCRLYEVTDLIPGVQSPYESTERRFLQLFIGVSDNQRHHVLDPYTYEKIGAWCSERDEAHFISGTHQLLVYTTSDGHRRIQKLFARLRQDHQLSSRLRFYIEFMVD